MYRLESAPRCGAPTHLLPCFQFAHAALLVPFMCGLGLCPFSGLVCDLLLRGGRGRSPECAWPEEYLGHNLDEHCLEDTGPLGALLSHNILHFPIDRVHPLIFPHDESGPLQWARPLAVAQLQLRAEALRRRAPP